MNVAINEQCHRVLTMLLGTAKHMEQIQEVLGLTCRGLIHAKWLPKELSSTSLPGNIEGGTHGSPRNGCIAHISAHLQHFSLPLNNCHGHCDNPVH